MSPAAVDVRSPTTSPHSKVSTATSLQNPGSIPHTHLTWPFNFAAFSSTSADAPQCCPDSAFQRSGSVASGRSRPRLVKVRKQLGSQHGRFKTSSSEIEPGFNPFSSLSNGTSPFNRDNGNVGFVFGANQSGSSKNLDNRDRQSGESAVKLSYDENGECNIGNGTEPTKIGNVGFVFGTRENLFGEKRQSATNAKEMVSDYKETVTEAKCGNFYDVGSVFCPNWSGSASNSNAKETECADILKKWGCDDSGKTKLETFEESGKHCGGAFAFGSNQFDLASNLNSENGESTKSVKKPECGGTLEKKTYTFDSHSSDSKYTSNLQSGQFRGDFCQSGCYGATNMEIGNEAEFMKYNDSCSVFGASWFNSASNLSAERRDSGENLGKPASNVRRKMKVGSKREFQKMKATAVKTNTNGGCSLDGDSDVDVFKFGSSSKTASSLSGCTAAKCENERKLNNKSSSNCSCTTKIQINNFHSDVSGKCMYKSDSCGNISTVSSATSVDKLPDEMKKLNISDSVNVEGVEEAKTSFFKARIEEKVSSCANGSSETTPSYQNSERPSVHVEITSGGNSRTIDQGHVLFGSVENAANASGVPVTEPFTFRTGLGENVGVGVGQCPQFQGIDGAHPNVASTPSTFKSVGLEFQPSISNAACVGVKDKDKNFTRSQNGLEMPSVDFRTSVCDPASLKENLFPESVVKNRSIKGKRLRKTKGNLKKSVGKQWPYRDQVPKESSSKENPDSPGCYSPMDFSPCQEASVSDQDLRRTSRISNNSFHQDRNCPPCASDATVPPGLESEDLATAKMEQVSSSNGAGVASADAGVDFNSDIEKQEKSSRSGFHFTSGLEEEKGKSFTFSATSNVQGSISEKKRRHKTRIRMKVGHASFVITPSPNSKFEPSSVQSSPLSCTSSVSEAADKSEAGEQSKQGFNSSASGTYETCESWRLRGNKAYKDRDLSKAEDFYTRGIISVPSNERSGCCLEPLVLCYSNRSVARMCLGKMREAIGDCMMATALDPSFLKAQMRAANCHLVLGEVKDAMKYFSKCMESGGGVCLDRRIIIDASDGLQKAQKVAEWTDISAKLLEQKNPDAALSATESISKALSISLYSETLLEMKAEALFMLRSHEEAIQVCEQSLCFAEKNFISGNESFSLVKLWRWCLISKSYFHLGRLEAALALLDKLTLVGSIKDKCENKNLESSVSLAVTIAELLRHKNAGNEAFKSGKYAEAVEHYTVALSNNVESRPFAAICFCNRAAAHQALGQIADAIADCSLAIALDGNYSKAVSRRATLHEMIRDYAQAATDLQRLVSILENKSDNNTKESCTPGRSAGSVKELRKAQSHLPVMEEEAKKGICLDLYLILGSKPSDTASDIKKAYRKAALKHHPDKAGQFLARSDIGDEGRLWKEISQEVNKDADRLFKMIGEAYAVLSDPDKRLQYDIEEEVRKDTKGSNGNSTQSRATDFHRRSDYPRYPYERNAYRRNCRENWKTYGDSYSRW